MTLRQAKQGLVVIPLLLLMSMACGPSRKRPSEANLSSVPPLVVEAFRRQKPNSIILEAEEVRGDQGPEWRIVQYTPLYEKRVTYYSPEGDKLRGW